MHSARMQKLEDEMGRHDPLHRYYNERQKHKGILPFGKKARARKESRKQYDHDTDYVNEGLRQDNERYAAQNKKTKVGFTALDELLEFDSAPLSTYREWKHMVKGRDTLQGMKTSALRDEAIKRRKKIIRRGGATAILGLGAYGGVKLMKRRKRDK
jgi:hypothetical protein